MLTDYEFENQKNRILNGLTHGTRKEPSPSERPLGLVASSWATAITVTAMLLVRRRAPEGSYFTDGDRASGVFGVLATGFSVLLGFIIFLAFPSYDESRSGAEQEATIVAQQVADGPVPARRGLRRAHRRAGLLRDRVAGPEWDALDAGTLGDRINPWGAEMFLTISDRRPADRTEQSAYDRWMDQTSDREQARIARVHGAEGIIPLPLWLALFVISAVVFAYLLFFADPAEGPVTQGMLMGSVTVVIALLLLLLVFFDHPHGDGVGRLQPTAMERTLRLIDIQPRPSASTSSLPVTRAWQRPLTRRRTAGATGRRLVATVLLVVAALATSWSSYQATRWNGEQAAAAGRPTRSGSTRRGPTGLARTQTQVDVATFIAWADADLRGDEGRRLLRGPLPRRVPAGVRSLDRPATADQRRRADHTLRHGGVPGRRQEAGRGARRRGRGVGRGGAAGHPALEQLRADRGALRHRALLRGDEHAAQQPSTALGDDHRRHGRAGRRPGLDGDLPGEPRRLTRGICVVRRGQDSVSRRS